MQFVGSFPDPTVVLDPPLPEIGFLGRSNVGKSSLLNALLGRRSLARVSGTPGKTTTLNVYRLPAFYLIDLPGYGFAHAAKSARLEFRRLIEQYLERDGTLAGVVWLLDIRHFPSADDRRFRELLAQRELPMLLVLTKADKLGRDAQQAQQRTIAQALELAEDQIQPTSSRTGLGIADLGASILAAAGREE